VRVLDMRGSHHSLHPDTRRALGASRKSIVLLNRRGWSNFLSCKSCGKAWECPNCDVALVLHRAEHTLACHHCGHRERVPSRCDVCGSLSVARHGAGTERVESELRHALDVPVFRLDADTAANKDAVPELLARFAAAPEGLLLGTQMVAKGHDFPDVTLGVVLDADSTLRFPDFRAEERTFALIAQLAGRAGRGPRGGRVLVQTNSPDAPSILAAARHDADGFLKGELERRRAWAYPPFTDLIRVITSSLEDARPAHAAAARLAQEIDATGTELLGPAPLFRLRNRERFQLVLKTTARAEAIAATGAAVEAAARDRAFKDVNFSVDVDPT
jgi:primosomal protein N' (replication factor Y)